MKSKLKQLATLLCLACIVQMPAFAEPTAKDREVEDLVRKITARTNELENEVKLLKAQLKELKQQRSKQASEASKSSFKPPVPAKTVRVCKLSQKPIRRVERVCVPCKSAVPCGSSAPCESATSGFQTPEQVRNLAACLLHGTAVITSPYLGERSAFDGSDLIVLNAGMNQDVHILKEECKLRAACKKLGHPQVFPETPILALSGRVESQAVAGRGFDNTASSDINLTAVELDMVPIINNWVTGLIVYKFDNSFTTPRRINNSRIYLDNGFATIGNFEVCPVYLTLGQMFVPFAGQYSSFMLSTPLPQQMGDARERAVLLGYQPLSGNGLYGAIYGYHGASHTSRHTFQNINNGGINLGYKYHSPRDWSADIGAAYIGNIADAIGFQENGAGIARGFVGFDATNLAERLEHVVPGLDLHSNFSVGCFRLYVEYVGALRTFCARNLSFNGKGAQPKSANIEGAYKFSIRHCPASVAVGYARTWEALALNLPEQRYNAVFNISIWKDTIASVEYRHDLNYPKGTFAGGNGILGFPVPFIPGDALGSTADQLTLQFGIYF